MLDETGHVRQVAENLHSAVHSSKSAAIIETILNDIHQGSDHSWRNCLSVNANRNSYISYNGRDDVSIRAPSPTPSTCTWPASFDGEFFGLSSFIIGYQLSSCQRLDRSHYFAQA